MTKASILRNNRPQKPGLRFLECYCVLWKRRRKRRVCQQQELGLYGDNTRKRKHNRLLRG